MTQLLHLLRVQRNEHRLVVTRGCAPSILSGEEHKQMSHNSPSPLSLLRMLIEGCGRCVFTFPMDMRYRIMILTIIHH